MYRIVVYCLAIAGMFSIAESALRWSDQSRLFRGSSLSDVVWTGERYVAVGSMVLTSIDGMSWRLADGVSEKFLDWVVWTGDRFIAFGGGWRADWLTSPDGLTWTNHVAVGRYFYHSVWTGARMVATGDSGTIFTSEDLTKWTRQDVAGAANFTNVIWTGTRVVAVGDKGTIVTSDDCVRWTKQVAATTRKLYDAVWTGTQLVAVGDSGTVLTSADGAAWTLRSVPTTDEITDIVWTGALLVATNRSAKALTSPDGIVWKKDDGYPRLQRVVRGTGCIYGMRVGYDSVYMSTDSISWKPLVLPESTADLSGFTYGNNRLIMVGDTLTVIGGDPAGKSTMYWKGGIPCLYRINHTKKGYAAVGDKGVVITSQDGFAWRRYSVPMPYRVNFVTATDSLYIIGCGSSIFTSPDCSTWAEKKFSTVSLNDAVSNDSLVVMVGYNGAINTSREGVNWTSRSSKTNDALNTIIWTGEKFIVGTASTSTYGASDCMLTSPDGVTWTNHPRKPQGTILDIAWSGSTLVAVGYGNRVSSTVDLIEWKWYECEKFTLQDFFSVEWTGREFVAAGTFDSVYTSVDGNTWMSQYFSGRQVVKSLLWADSMLFAAGGYDDSASLMIGKYDTATGCIATRQAAFNRSGGKRPILYTGNYLPRITNGGVLYTLDGRLVTRIPPAGRAARAASSRTFAAGGRILRQ